MPSSRAARFRQKTQRSHRVDKSLPGSVPRFIGDSLVVCSDIHTPRHDPKAINTMLDWANQHRIKTCLINGDFFDNEEISDYGKGSSKAPPLIRQLGLGFDLLGAFAEVFREIHVLCGNHDDRLIRLLRAADGKKPRELAEIETLYPGSMCLDQPYHVRYVKMLGGLLKDRAPATAKLTTFHPFGLGMIAAAQRWMVVHQDIYSRNSPDEARKLWERHICSVITSHTHHVGLRVAPDGKNIWINPGCLTKERYHRYLFERVRGGPAWSQGFVSFNRGNAKLHIIQPGGYGD